jgi:hypothetical protein
MTKEFCDICGRPIETYKNVSEFKVKRLRWVLHGNICWKRLTVHNACWRELCKQIAETTITYEPMEDDHE